MLNVLLCVDGSRESNKAVKNFVQMVAALREMPQVHLLTVHRPVPGIGGMSRALSKGSLHKYYKEETDSALKSAQALLRKARIDCVVHAEVGDIASTIVRLAGKQHCDMIYMGTRGMGAVSGLVMGSTATKVLHLASVPVVLVH
jgi:nucleotide-binding universal stress UspA family protein